MRSQDRNSREKEYKIALRDCVSSWSIFKDGPLACVYGTFYGKVSVRTPPLPDNAVHWQVFERIRPGEVPELGRPRVLKFSTTDAWLHQIGAHDEPHSQEHQSRQLLSRGWQGLYHWIWLNFDVPKCLRFLAVREKLIVRWFFPLFIYLSSQLWK
jgi:hypothetical protein